MPTMDGLLKLLLIHFMMLSDVTVTLSSGFTIATGSHITVTIIILSFSNATVVTVMDVTVIGLSYGYEIALDT